MSNKKISILIPDGEAPVLMIVLNCLSDVKGIKVHVISNDNDIPMKYSNKIYKFSYFSKSNSQTDFIEKINVEVKKHNIDLIMPIFVDAIQVILKNINLISSKEKLALLPSFNNFTIANNKGLLSNHLENNNLPFPKSQIIKKGVAINVDKIKYPVLVKPVDGIGGGVGIYVFDKKNTLVEFLDSDAFDTTYLLQDYVVGYDIDCSVLCKNGEILAYTIQKPNMFANSKFEPQLAFEFLKKDELLEVVKKLMKTLNWSGVAHLDLRYDKNSNEYKVLEINPRFWGSVEASLFAGVNFPYLYCISSLNFEFDIPQYKFIQFTLLKGLVKNIKKDKSILLKVKYIFNNTPIKYMLNDPKPTLYRFSRFIFRKIRL